jgi:hypothetical protein
MMILLPWFVFVMMTASWPTAIRYLVNGEAGDEEYNAKSSVNREQVHHPSAKGESGEGDDGVAHIKTRERRLRSRRWFVYFACSMPRTTNTFLPWWCWTLRVTSHVFLVYHRTTCHKDHSHACPFRPPWAVTLSHVPAAHRCHLYCAYASFHLHLHSDLVKPLGCPCTPNLVPCIQRADRATRLQGNNTCNSGPFMWCLPADSPTLNPDLTSSHTSDAIPSTPIERALPTRSNALENWSFDWLSEWVSD